MWLCLIKINSPIDKNIFSFLLQFSPAEKQARILRQKVKQNADTMVVGGALLRHMIFQEFHVPWEKQIIAYGPYGKPYLRDYPDAHFNISHSGSYVACAVSDEPIGIDIQEVTVFDHDLAKMVFSTKVIAQISESADPDLEFTRSWAKMEAQRKLDRKGFAEF